MCRVVVHYESIAINAFYYLVKLVIVKLFALVKINKVAGVGV